MQAIDNVVAHFKRNQNRVITVEEWGAEGEPLQIYHDPVTPRELDKVAAENRGNLDSFGACVDLICMKAKTQTGEKMFDATARENMLSMADGQIVQLIAQQMRFLFLRVDAAKN